MEGGGGGAGIVSSIISLAIGIFYIFCMWKIFTKAGKPGWAVIIPIYNIIVLLQIVGRPIWWLILYFVPLVNIIIGIILIVDLAKKFGKGVGFALGLIFLSFIFIPILALGSAKYEG